MRRRGIAEAGLFRKRRSCRDSIAAAAVFVIGLFGLACGPNATILNSGKETPAPVTGERPVSSFEEHLETMRTANFEYIFALRRKDGGKLDAEDKAFVKQNMPPEVNRLVVSDDNKAVIAGSHFPFPPEALKLLQARFNFENFSSAANGPAEKNVNANVNR